MDSLEAWLDFQKGERVTLSQPKRCSECDQVKDDVDLFAEDPETGEQVYMCGLCIGKEELAAHQAQGLPVECLVTFDGIKTPNCVSPGWHLRYTYGTLLTDGRIMWGDREVKPPSYERVAICD